MYEGVISSTQKSWPSFKTIFAALLVSVPMYRFTVLLVTLVAYSIVDHLRDTPSPYAARRRAFLILVNKKIDGRTFAPLMLIATKNLPLL
jgi:hypothetical protein